MEELAALGIGIWGLAILVAAAFVAGFIDSIAGGGGLITLPAALMVGVPPHITLGSTKFMASLGTSAACINYARSGAVAWRVVAVGVVFSLAGSAFGARAVLFIDAHVLGKIMVFLLPFAAAGVFLSFRKEAALQKVDEMSLFFVTPAVCLLIGFYDGFYGPGTGSFLLLALHLALKLDLVCASATAKPFNLASNISALVVFLLHGQVLYQLAVPMALGNIAGNVLGSNTAIAGGAQVVRKVLFISLILLFFTLLHKYSN